MDPFAQTTVFYIHVIKKAWRRLDSSLASARRRRQSRRAAQPTRTSASASPSSTSPSSPGTAHVRHPREEGLPLQVEAQEVVPVVVLLEVSKGSGPQVLEVVEVQVLTAETPAGTDTVPRSSVAGGKGVRAATLLKRRPGTAAKGAAYTRRPLRSASVAPRRRGAGATVRATSRRSTTGLRALRRWESWIWRAGMRSGC